MSLKNKGCVKGVREVGREYNIMFGGLRRL